MSVEVGYFDFASLMIYDTFPFIKHKTTLQDQKENVSLKKENVAKQSEKLS